MKSRENEIFTKKVTAGKRTYFFDVKKSSENDLYLVISESVYQSDGSHKHHRIMIFPEVAKEFQNALNETMQNIVKYPRKERKRNLPNRAGEKWKEYEVKKLVEEHKNGTNIQEIAILFERTTGAITSRLKKEGLIE